MLIPGGAHHLRIQIALRNEVLLLSEGVQDVEKQRSAAHTVADLLREWRVQLLHRRGNQHSGVE
mgnify:FL=1